MSEKVIVANIVAIFVATGGVYIAHVAGMKYIVPHKEGLPVRSATIMLAKAAFFVLLAIVIAQFR